MGTEREKIDKARPHLALLPNVVSVGYGLKRKADRWTSTHAIIVYVSHKLPPSVLAAQEMVPAELEGLPTDVVEVKAVPGYPGL